MYNKMVRKYLHWTLLFFLHIIFKHMDAACTISLHVFFLQTNFSPFPVLNLFMLCIQLEIRKSQYFTLLVV